MTEEEKNDQQAAEEAAEETEPEPPAEAEEAAIEEEPPAVEEPAPAERPAAEAEAREEEEGEPLGPKQRRKLERSRHSGETRPQRSPQERVQERAERRRGKAASRRTWRARTRERRKGRATTQPPAPVARERGKPKQRQGVVVSDKADKTITVRIDSQRAHRVYGKVVRTSAMLHAHDEGNEAHVGDTVRVVESRPLSRTKRWRLVEVLERAR